MQYITAAEAGRRIGVSEKTVRLWVQAGKLTAHHPARNRLAIPVPEVERLARERQQYVTPITGVGEPTTTTVPDVATLQRELVSLRQEVEALRNEVQSLQGRLNRADTAIAPGTGTPSIDTTKRIGRPPGRVTVSPGLPEGAILASNFAKAHGVNPRTFRDQIAKGAYGERVEAESRPKPSRPDEIEWYLTPDQQDQARQFWDRHGVPFTMPDTTG